MIYLICIIKKKYIINSMNLKNNTLLFSGPEGGSDC